MFWLGFGSSESGCAADADSVWVWVLGAGFQVFSMVGTKFSHGPRPRPLPFNAAVSAELWEPPHGGQALLWSLV